MGSELDRKDRKSKTMPQNRKDVEDGAFLDMM